MSSKESSLRIVLVGRVGTGKTSSMNTILSSSDDNDKPNYPSSSEKYHKKTVKIGKQDVLVVDTPGLSDSEKSDKEVLEEIKQGVSAANPGPHVFLFVLSCSDCFTREEQDVVEMIKKTFGNHVTQHIMVLFTSGDNLKADGNTIQDFIKGDLQEFVDECKGRYHVFDNKIQSVSQVTELLEKINSMVQENRGSYYRSPRQRRIALAVSGSAVAGAGLGGVISHAAGISAGIPVGVAAGAAVGSVVGAVGIVTAEHAKAKSCVVQ